MTRSPFTLTEEEAKALYDHFTKRARYISYEFDYPIILLIGKLARYIEEYL